MIEFTTADILLGIMVLAGILVLQFYKGRKVNLYMQEQVIKALEEVFRPVDKIYQVIGIYVGFRGVLKLDNPYLERIEVTTILLPRHSILYYPISRLTTRMDKVFLVAVPKGRVPGEAHVVRRGYYRLGTARAIEGSELMRWEEMEAGGARFDVLEGGASAGPLKEFVQSLPNPGEVNHVALVPSNNTLYLALRLKVEDFRQVAEAFNRLAESLFS